MWLDFCVGLNLLDTTHGEVCVQVARQQQIVGGIARVYPSGSSSSLEEARLEKSEQCPNRHAQLTSVRWSFPTS